MLLKITRKCNMRCTHCLEEATPDGAHMTMETFDQAVAFIQKAQPLLLILTGGEPTDHPNFIEMATRIISILGKERVMVASNGLFLYNQTLTEQVANLGVPIQITNDVRYYPLAINHIEHPNFCYVDHIESMFPQGRAVKNGYEPKLTKAPMCFNLRSLSCSGKFMSFFDAVRALELHGKFCTPAIGIHGEILMGESSLCNNIGHVTEDEFSLLKKVKSFNCNRCKMEDVLPATHHAAIHPIPNPVVMEF